MAMFHRSRILEVVAASTLAVVLAACAGQPREVSPYGHVADGVYILPPNEQAYTCAESEGAIRWGVRKAFERVGEGNRQAVITMVSNVVSFGMGGIPRGINFGSGERFAGRQELTKALALDSAARAKGCDGVDIPALVDVELGEGSLENFIAKQSEQTLDPVLEEEAAIKGRIQ